MSLPGRSQLACSPPTSEGTSREPQRPLCCLRRGSKANHPPNHSSTRSNSQQGHNSEQSREKPLPSWSYHSSGRDQSPNLKNKTKRATAAGGEVLGRKTKPGRAVGSVWQSCSLIGWSAPSESRSGGKEGALRTQWGRGETRAEGPGGTTTAELEEQPGSLWPLQLQFSL